MKLRVMGSILYERMRSADNIGDLTKELDVCQRCLIARRSKAGGTSLFALPTLPQMFTAIRGLEEIEE